MKKRCINISNYDESEPVFVYCKLAGEKRSSIINLRKLIMEKVLDRTISLLWAPTCPRGKAEKILDTALEHKLFMSGITFMIRRQMDKKSNGVGEILKTYKF